MGHLPDEFYPRRTIASLDLIPSPDNRATVHRYLDERKANRIKVATLANEANAMLRSYSKDGKVTVTSRPVTLSDSTLACRVIILRCFFKWLRGGDEYPPEVKGIKSNRPREDSIPTDKLLTADDLRALLQAHPSPRDKALIAVLHDSGLRAGELCALNIGSVQFDEHGAVVVLPKKARGLKTGARRVRLFESAPYLQAWWESHPRKDEPDAPLFYTASRRAPGARITPGALWKFCSDASKRSALRKKIHPHLFRHSAATERARQGWRESEMRSYFGWARGSDMPSTYVHLAGEDYERMELERRGLKQTAPEERRALAPRTCPMCKAENLLTASFCQRCRHPISPTAEAAMAEQRRSDLKEELARMVATHLKEEIAQQVRSAMEPSPSAERQDAERRGLQDPRIGVPSRRVLEI
ncbi:MAG: site-specific integrase [Euryarchaeota archaeon]|nr:site-specific integrase [Euryarchaeota archaeon]